MIEMTVGWGVYGGEGKGIALAGCCAVDLGDGDGERQYMGQRRA